MPNQFNSPEGDLENYFVTESWLIDQYVGDELWIWGNNVYGQLGLGTASTTDNKFTPVNTSAGGTNWKQISAGYRHTAAIKTDGTLWTWGNNSSGQLGNLLSTDIAIPITTFAGGTNWKQVSAGRFHTAAIKTDGTLWTWGSNSTGALGNQFFRDPVTTFAGGTNWSDTATGAAEELYTISAGGFQMAALKTDGTLWAWGNGSYGGTVGNAQTTNALTPITTFIGGTNWRQISGGRAHTAAIKTDGTLWVWGNTANGRLGNAVTTGTISTPVTTFAGGTNWRQVSGGESHTAAVKTDGTLWVWGNQYGGQLGNFAGSSSNISTPITTFSGGTNWKQVSCGGVFTAAVKTDGTLWAWGNNSAGPVGNASSVNVITPVTTFSGGTNWKQVSTGRLHAASVKTDGTLWVWGNNFRGRLGQGYSGSYGANQRVTTPVTTFAGGTNWRQVSCGGYHSIAVKTDGTLWTWGNNGLGALGIADDSVGISILTPVTTFAGGTNWKQASAGFHSNIALTDDGVNKRIYVWGSNGLNSTTYPGPTLGINIDQNSIFQVNGDWKQASAGSSYTAAIKTDGTLWTWGSNFNGILGNNITLTRYTPITTFAGGTNWKQVSAGYQTTASVKTDGTLWAWGITTGSRGAFPFNNTPITTFAGGTNWSDTATGAAEELYTLSSSFKDASFAIKTDGTLWVWGNNGSGRLGNASTVNAIATPITTFAGGTNWKQISAGYSHTAAIKTDGTLWVWGNNYSGRLGNASTVNVSTPITTFAGGTNWRQVSTGPVGISATKTDGTLWVWGSNGSGRLGNASTVNSSTPITTFAGGTDWKQVSDSGFVTAAVKTDGTLWIWGNASFGKLGNASTVNVSTPITTFAGGTNWKQVSCGYGNIFNTYVAAVKTDGTLWAWGNALYGKLGNASTVDVSTPITTFAGGTNWKQVSGGSNHTVAIKTDGTLWAWGNQYLGRLGNNVNDSSISISTPVTTFAGGTNWKQASAGNSHTLALNDDGVNKRLYAWGNNVAYNLGNNFNALLQFNLGGTNWKQVSCSNSQYQFSIVNSAIKTDGTLWTWGYGGGGRLGTASLNNSPTPVTTFAGGNNWKQVSSAAFITSAIKTDGTLWTWGSNSYGLLGNASTVNASTPVTTFAGGTNWKQVSGGGRKIGAVFSGTIPDLPIS